MHHRAGLFFYKKSAQTLFTFLVEKFLRMGFGEGTFFKKFLPREKIHLQLLFVLVDFLEVLVGVNLEFAACCFVAGNDSVRMHLESGDGPCVVNAAFYAVTESA